ncbi:protein-glutamine gamma-glutamyltransferase [Bacillus sp. CECT 9360]|uniref:protein-glutamine gamma-glutamyltransferase n=1 Tax=Bacillus sp. CECT 9360 TaxID=2845821 RepID=UPI001E297A12|nr:protein-glutamine gamma-glutamyltransferase [Bacillus sp. CECT 9360]CAH0345259.1 Protein-glutamine gamma-glutamyltransferase [Bacillus sp. CECT 9360]
MIQLLGNPFQQSGMWPSGSDESVIIQRMQEDPVVHSYNSIEELSFELELRKNIILSARAMNQGHARFEIFARSRCNAQYWHLTKAGGFLLRRDVMPSDAIQDIYRNSSLYAFECATAKVIIYYHAVLNSIGEQLFNQICKNLYLYSWHTDPDLGIHIIDADHFLPGDVVYFNNPDFDPKTYWWRGENAVVLGDGTYFGHGLGIRTAEQMIQALNKTRKPGSNQTAYLINSVTRPAFKHLAQFSILTRGYTTNKIQHLVIHHNESSISCNRYLYYLNKVYYQMT